MPTGTNTVLFVAKYSIPHDHKFTYAQMVAIIQPTKAEVNRVRVTVGGDRLDLTGATTTPCASLTTTKSLLNITLSTPGAQLMTLDIKDFYYGTDMAHYEYIKITLACIPDKIIDQYKLRALSSDSWVYLDIRKGMPSLKQAGRITNNRLKAHLAHFVFAPVSRTPALWKHTTKPIIFSLLVDYFVVKYIDKENSDYLIQALQKLYTISIDWTSSLFCGLTIDWDYATRTCNISMPKYLQTDLHKFQHPAPKRPQHAPRSWSKPNYGVHVQYAPDDDSSPLLSAITINLVQKTVGKLLYYSILVDPTILTALGSIVAQQEKGTEKTYSDTLWILDYAATYPNSTIQYTASDMFLHIHIHASYLSKPLARSRAGGHYFLGDMRPDMSKPPTTRPRLNGPIHSISQIMSNVMGSAAESELGAAYINGQEAVPIRTFLLELVHPQLSTPIQVDNSTADSFANDTIKKKRLKAIDMQFYWIRDRTSQG